MILKSFKCKEKNHIQNFFLEWIYHRQYKIFMRNNLGVITIIKFSNQLFERVKLFERVFEEFYKLIFLSDFH